MNKQVIEIIETLDEKVARREFMAAMHTKPMSTIEVVRGPGADIYRITVIESAWAT